MARYSDSITNQYGAPVVGASVYVYDRSEALATLTADGGGALANPVTSDQYGGFSFNTDDGLYDLVFHYGGKELQRRNGIQVGTGPVLPDEILSALSQGSAASLIGFQADGTGAVARTVQEKAGERRSPEDFGADGTAANDTAAFKKMIAQDIAIELPLGRSYYIEDDCLADHPLLAAGNAHCTVIGAPGASQFTQPRIVVTKPGVTPFAPNTNSKITGITFEYEQQGLVPAVSGDTWPYANAVECTGTIAQSGGKPVLTLSAGSFADCSRGSTVVVLADQTKYQDYWVNNYDSFDAIFQIERITSSTTAILQGKLTAAYSNKRIHIRGNCMSVIWGYVQPTEIDFTHNHLGAIPGCGLMVMGSQKTHFRDNYIADFGAPHLAAIFSGNGAGINLDNGAGGGWAEGCPNHENAAERNMMFYGCGGYFINGWADARFVQNQIDQNAHVNDALATYFHNFQASYVFSNVKTSTIEQCSPEDTMAPDGMFLDACVNLVPEAIRGYDLEPTAYTLVFNNCTDCSYEAIKNDGGAGDTAKIVRFANQGSTADQEVRALQGGRGGSGSYAYQNGAFGTFVADLDERDIRWFTLNVTSAAVLAATGAFYTFTLAPSLFSGFAGFDDFVIAEILVANGGVWASPGPTVPTIRGGISGSDQALFAATALSDATGLLVPMNLVRKSLPAATNLQLVIATGDGSAWNGGGHTAHNLAVRIKVEGLRS